LAIDWTNASGGVEVAVSATAQEFIDALRPSNSHWWEGAFCPWVFRGHAYEEWELLPSAWRSSNTILNVHPVVIGVCRRSDIDRSATGSIAASRSHRPDRGRKLSSQGQAQSRTNEGQILAIWDGQVGQFYCDEIAAKWVSFNVLLTHCVF